MFETLIRSNTKADEVSGKVDGENKEALGDGMVERMLLS